MAQAHPRGDSLFPDPDGTVVSAPTTPWSWCRVAFWARMACDAALLLNIAIILRPDLLGDDWQILVQSWTWDGARASLWQPHNEHSMPLGRLSIWLMAQLAGKPTNVPLVMALQGPLAIVAAMVLVYLLVRRETGQPFPALLAMTLFGVNTHYQNAVAWFSASFTVLALDTLLLGLLAAQRWRQTGRRRYLILSALWCALAPGWFATGVLAGPLCLLYLLAPGTPDPGKPRQFLGWFLTLWPRLLATVRHAWLPALIPLLGTVVSLAITMPLNGKQIANLPRVEVEATALETFKPEVGLKYTCRAMVDDLIPGAAGFSEVTSSITVVNAVWVVFVLLGAWWWWQAPHPSLLLLGLGLIVVSYWLIYTGRAYFEYEGMHHWGRYHLFAHLGLVLFVCGGLPRRFVTWLSTAPGLAIDLGVACLLVLLLLTQFPRASGVGYDPQQYADLERVEGIDARCRKDHIAAATAKEALGEFEIDGMLGGEIDGRRLSGWDLLRGSNDPLPMTVEEARDLLGRK